jgi:DNA-binding SARP family transcriptional activator
MCEHLAVAQTPVRILGGVRLQRPDGDDARVGGPLAARLLGALVSSLGAPVLYDVLTDVLWRDDPPANPVAPLRMAVSRLRGRLADAGLDDSLRSVSGGYLLGVDPEHVDATRFADLVARARTIAPTDPVRAASLLEGALALWRGVPFGSMATESWAVATAQRLDELRLAAEEELADQPLRERRSIQLAIALYRLERQAEALRVLDSTRHLLRDELGLDAGDELRETELRILDHDARLRQWAPEVVIAAAHDNPLTGRERDVRTVADLLAANRLVTIHGFGGAGKSALARAVAASSAHGQVLHAAIDGLQGGALAGAIAESVGVGAVEDPADLAATVALRLGTAPMLLVIDGAEAGLEEVAALVERVLALAPRVRVLVTSRLPLGAGGEVRFHLDALPIGDAALPGPAVQLLVSRAGLSLEQTSDDDVQSLLAICALAGGLPGALELAAAAIDTLGPVTAAPRAGTAAQAHREGVLLWALDAVSPAARTLLDHLATLPSGATPASIAALAGIDEEQVRTTISGALQGRLLEVATAPAGLRYRPPDHVREGLTALAGSDALPAGRVVAHLTDLFAAAGFVDTKPDRARIATLTDELANLRYLLSITIGTLAGLELAIASSSTWAAIGLGNEGDRWLRSLLEAAPSPPPLQRARATVASAAMRGGLAASASDEADLEDALVTAAEAGDDRLWVLAGGRLAAAVGFRGDAARSATLLTGDEAKRRLAAIADPWLYTLRDMMLPLGLAITGDPLGARAGLSEVPRRFMALDDPSMAVATLYFRAFLARAAGELSLAAADLDAARELAAEDVNAATMAQVRAEAAHLARFRGDASAPSLLAQAIEDCERSGNVRTAAALRLDRGEWRLEDGDDDGRQDILGALPLLLRVDRRAAGAAIALLVTHGEGMGPQTRSRLAGAAGRLALREAGVPPSNARLALVEATEARWQESMPADVAAGAALLDDELETLIAAHPG